MRRMHRPAVWKAAPGAGEWRWVAEVQGSLAFHETWEEAIATALSFVELHNREARDSLVP